jgi:hypothetical protein
LQAPVPIQWLLHFTCFTKCQTIIMNHSDELPWLPSNLTRSWTWVMIKVHNNPPKICTNNYKKSASWF